MPLTELVRYFNAADQACESVLYLESGRAAAWHRGLRLTSLFEPIVRLRDEQVIGHRAALLVRQPDDADLPSLNAYAACESAESIVHFDRLCRTLHALNFLAQQRRTGGYLQLAVHVRHLLAVPNQHGLVYEAILKRCGLSPEDIVLEIAVADVPDLTVLQPAISNYQSRGYRIALTEVSPAHLPLLAQRCRPDWVRLAPFSEEKALDFLKKNALTVEVGGLQSGSDLRWARQQGLLFGSGPLLGEAKPDCLPTHRASPLAYNNCFNFGVQT